MISTDGKIACCRINYDDYVNFEIEVLTPKEIDEYKGKEQGIADDSFKKLQVLKKMLENNLITAIEYDKKKTELMTSF